MADDKGKPTPGQESIKRHKPQQSLDMPGPGGSQVRADAANKVYAKDRQEYNSSRLSKYDKVENKSFSKEADLKLGDRGKLSKEFGKDKGIER